MSETKQRLTRLQESMVEAGVDLVAIGPTVNMRYLAGYASYPDERLCLLLVSPENAVILTPALNAGDFEAYTDFRLYRWTDSEGPQQALKDSLAGVQVNILAIDGTMRADFLLLLLKVIKPQQTISAEELLSSLRICKSSAEIELLAKAAAQADLAMQAAIDACQPGVTEAEVAWAAETAFRRDGAEKATFTQVASGPNGAFPHHHSGQRQLQMGDAIVIDLAAILNGYQSDICRMVFLGDPPDDFVQAYQAVLQANARARAAIKQGITPHDVDRIARSTLEAAGLGDAFIHRTGHGIGIEVHEPPYIMTGNEQPLEEGMVFSIEPGVYFPNRFGLRIEDIVVVTATGSRVLTGSSHELVVK